MIIREIRVEEFGKFSGYAAQDLPSGMVIFQGPNEAGKSTLLHFIRQMLFGMARANSKDYVPPLGGKNHGGSLVIEKDGQTLGLSRYSGKKGVTLTFPDGETGGEADLKLVLGHMDATVYRAVFGFDLGDIQELLGLDEGAVRDRLFSTGITGAGADVSKVLAGLDEKLGALLKTKGDSLLGRNADKIKALAERKKSLSTELARYDALSDEMASLAAQSERLSEELKDLGAKERRLKRLADIHPLWLKLVQNEEKLKNAGGPGEFPAEGLGRLASLEAELKRHGVDALECEARLKTLRDRIGPLAVDENLLKVLPLGEEFLPKLPLFEDKAKRLDDLRSKIVAQEGLLADELSVLGRGWTPERLKQADLGPARTETAREFYRRFSDHDARANQAREQRDQAAHKLKMAQAQECADPKSNLGLYLIIVGVAGLAGAAIAPQNFAFLLLPLGGALLGAGMLKLLAKTPGPNALELSRAVNAAKLEAESCEERLARALRHGDALKAEWSATLAGWGFEEQSPNAAATLMAGLSAAAVRLREIERDRALLAKLSEEQEEFVESVRKALADLGLTPPQGGEALAELERLVAKAGSEAQKKTQAAALAEKIDDEEAKKKAIASKADAAKEELQKLLTAAKAKDAEDFRLLHAQCSARKELAREREGIRENILVLAGSFEGASRAVEELKSRGVDSIKGELEETAAKAGELSAQYKEVNRRYGEAKASVDRLMTSDELQKLEFESDALKEGTLALARNWRVLALARALARDALNKYAQESQPAVLREAGAVFSSITGGRYLKIMQDAGQNQLLVLRADGEALPAHKLSRGTREELYVSLRLGLAREFCQKGQKFPLIADDVFVNFDEERRDRALEELVKFSQGCQTIFFTCHGATLKSLEKILPNPRIIHLTTQNFAGTL